jgi:hypothetical protein
MDGIEEDCQMILDHSEITWNGSNHVGTFDDQAEEASVRIYEYIESWPYDSADVYEVWAAGDYLSDNDLDDLGLTGTSTDDEIRAKAEALVEEAEVALDVDDMEQYLLALRADVD